MKWSDGIDSRGCFLCWCNKLEKWNLSFLQLKRWDHYSTYFTNIMRSKWCWIEHPQFKYVEKLENRSNGTGFNRMYARCWCQWSSYMIFMLKKWVLLDLTILWMTCQRSPYPPVENKCSARASASRPME